MRPHLARCDPTMRSVPHAGRAVIADVRGARCLKQHITPAALRVLRP
ncbi:hypothetical protein ACUXK4_000837 [Methylorubrum extorquens]